MITTAEDQYTWRILPEKEHLFKKYILKEHISKQSIGAYRQLYQAIGDSLEAVVRTDSGGINRGACQESAVMVGISLGTREDNPSSEINFNTAIEVLETDKAKLMANVSELNDQVAAATDTRRQAEEEASRLREALQEKEADKQLLLHTFRELTAMLDCWRSTTVKSANECL